MRRLNLGFHLSHITTTSCTGPDRIGTVQIVKVAGPGRSIFWLDRSISKQYNWLLTADAEGKYKSQKLKTTCVNCRTRQVFPTPVFPMSTTLKRYLNSSITTKGHNICHKQKTPAKYNNVPVNACKYKWDRKACNLYFSTPQHACSSHSNKWNIQVCKMQVHSGSYWANMHLQKHTGSYTHTSVITSKVKVRYWTYIWMLYISTDT